MIFAFGKMREVRWWRVDGGGWMLELRRERLEGRGLWIDGNPKIKSPGE